MLYFNELCRAMKLLANNPKVLFLGQSVAYSGNSLYKTLENIPIEKRLEMPVAEDMQMGLSTGLALEGFIPVSIFPRFDFLLLAVNQLANHLDKIEGMSNGQFSPKVIIRTAVGSKEPLYPGLQHCQDYTDAFKLLLKNIKVISLEKADNIVPVYMKALQSKKSTLIIERVDLYYA